VVINDYILTITGPRAVDRHIQQRDGINPHRRTVRRSATTRKGETDADVL
jgi:hypothetical protein